MATPIAPAPWPEAKVSLSGILSFRGKACLEKRDYRPVFFLRTARSRKLQLRAEGSMARQDRYTWEEQVAGDADDHEIDQQHQTPTEVVSDHFALVTDELAGRHTDARSLWGDRLSDFGADRIQRRQQKQRKAEDLADQRLERAEHGVGRGVAAGQRHADEAQYGRHDNEGCADLGEGAGEGAGHARVVEDIGKPEDKHANEACAPHL